LSEFATPFFVGSVFGKQIAPLTRVVAVELPFRLHTDFTTTDVTTYAKQIGFVRLCGESFTFHSTPCPKKIVPLFIFFF